VAKSVALLAQVLRQQAESRLHPGLMQKVFAKIKAQKPSS
jgi:hypothetical protein